MHKNEISKSLLPTQHKDNLKNKTKPRVRTLETRRRRSSSLHGMKTKCSNGFKAAASRLKVSRSSKRLQSQADAVVCEALLKTDKTDCQTPPPAPSPSHPADEGWRNVEAFLWSPASRAAPQCRGIPRLLLHKDTLVASHSAISCCILLSPTQGDKVFIDSKPSGTSSRTPWQKQRQRRNNNTISQAKVEPVSNTRGRWTRV